MVWYFYEMSWSSRVKESSIKKTFEEELLCPSRYLGHYEFEELLIMHSSYIDTFRIHFASLAPGENIAIATLPKSLLHNFLSVIVKVAIMLSM